MKAVILGAGGAVGAATARAIVAARAVDAVVLADRDASGLVESAKVLTAVAPAGFSIDSTVIDVEDGRSLRALLAGTDIVVNAVGPYYRFGVTVLEAAIETRTDYIDLCDDWEPTAAMLELNDRAAAEGVTAVVGMGASPGLASILAQRAAAELDQVHNLYTAWPVDVTDLGDGKDDTELLTREGGEPTAAAVHWMQQVSGRIPVVEDGAVVAQTPLRPVRLTLPGGKEGTAYTVGHPEPITLHRTFNLTGASACLMVITPGMVGYLKAIADDIDAGRLTNETAALALSSPQVRHLTKAAIRSARLRGPGSLPSFFAAAEGLRGGVRTTVLAQLAEEAQAMPDYSEMTRVTANPCAIVVGHLADGSLNRPGVHAPEAVVDGARFLGELDRLTGWQGTQPSVTVGIAPSSMMAPAGHA